MRSPHLKHLLALRGLHTVDLVLLPGHIVSDADKFEEAARAMTQPYEPTNGKRGSAREFAARGELRKGFGAGTGEKRTRQAEESNDEDSNHVSTKARKEL